MNIYTHTYYDDISINTMKMFVVRRYWNMDSEYIFAVMHICIYAYDRVCICIVCVCVVTHYTVTYLNDATSFALCRGLWFISV